MDPTRTFEPDGPPPLGGSSREFGPEKSLAIGHRGHRPARPETWKQARECRKPPAVAMSQDPVAIGSDWSDYCGAPGLQSRVSGCPTATRCTRRASTVVAFPSPL